MHRNSSSSSGTTFWKVTDDEAMPWMGMTIGPEPRSSATCRSGGRRNGFHPMTRGYRGMGWRGRCARSVLAELLLIVVLRLDAVTIRFRLLHVGVGLDL